VLQLACEPCIWPRCPSDLKHMTHIAYIAYIIVLISIWPRGHWHQMAMLVAANLAKLVPAHLAKSYSK
jgi:hypothetical protein